MTQSAKAKDAALPQAGESSEHLPRRDWLFLPLLSLLTLAVLLGSVEWIARKLYRASDTSTLSCLVVNDRKTGVRAIPNTICSEKIFESGLVEYKFNNCGYRTGQACGQKAPGVFRIVLIGSSLVEGMRVPQQQTFAAELPAVLSRITGRKVEIYNEGMQWGTPASIDLRIDDIFAAKPDLILWPLSPWDIQNVSLILPYVEGVQQQQMAGQSAPTAIQQAPRSLRERIVLAFQKERTPAQTMDAAWKRMIEPLDNTRSLFMMQHLLYESQSQYIRHYLMQGDSAGFLRTPTPPAWQSRLQEFDQDFNAVAVRAQSAHVPVVAVLLPNRAQAVMLATGAAPNGFDPQRLEAALKSIVQKNGAIYTGILHDFRNVARPERLYFPIDGHLNARGHAILTMLLAKELTSGAVPQLTGRTEHAASQHGTL